MGRYHGRRPYQNGPRGYNQNRGNFNHNMHMMNGMPQAPLPHGGPLPPNFMGQTQYPSSPIAAQFMSVTSKLIPSITPRNPYLKERVGEAIFPFIKTLVASERVPKITGMLIELPVEQMRLYMGSYENLQSKVKEADDLIN